VRTLWVLAVVAVFATAAGATVWPVVCLYDEKTPLAVVDGNDPIVFRDIMVGTHLTIIIRSDKAESFSGGLVMSREDYVFGALQPRGTPDRWANYADSCFYEAGSDAWTLFMAESFTVAVDFISTFVGGDRRFRDAVPGDWFIMDYHAMQVGSCAIGFYDYDIIPPDTPVHLIPPLRTLLLHHVPTRDFNADRIVDLNDFAILAASWRCPVDGDPNTPDAAFDFDADSRIDVADLALFCEFWLERTDAPLAADPNQG
jgi:hypothetical protein